MSNPENADVELILVPPRLRGGWPSDSEVGWGPPARSIEESKNPTLPSPKSGRERSAAVSLGLRYRIFKLREAGLRPRYPHRPQANEYRGRRRSGAIFGAARPSLPPDAETI